MNDVEEGRVLVRGYRTGTPHTLLGKDCLSQMLIDVRSDQSPNILLSRVRQNHSDQAEIATILFSNLISDQFRGGSRR